MKGFLDNARVLLRCWRERRRRRHNGAGLRDPKVALRYHCGYCDAGPGQPCVNTQWGGLTERPHYTRTPS